jgi:hypothetical protein
VDLSQSRERSPPEYFPKMTVCKMCAAFPIINVAYYSRLF